MSIQLSPSPPVHFQCHSSPQYAPPPTSPRGIQNTSLSSPKKMEIGRKPEKIDYEKFIDDCSPYPPCLIEFTGCCFIPFAISMFLSIFA